MRINHAIRTLIISDFFFNAGFSVFGPIFAIFITDQIQGGSLQVIGFAAAITQIFKASFQIPVARYLDKNHGEYDDFYSMVTGSFLIATVPFLYLFAAAPKHLYIINAFYGLGLALAIPPWYAIFSRHLDKMHENIEWSFESISVGISAAAAAALGGILANKFGFSFVFLLGGVFSIFASFMQIKIYKDLRGRVRRGVVKPQPEKP